MANESPSTAERLEVACAVAGGGPAGMMLGLLLARAGVAVAVFEKHADFLRDFRGDTIHPSTLELIAELGLLEDFLKRPHQEVRRLRGIVGDTELTVADFTHLPTRCRFIAFMPQWDFLDFLAGHARDYRTFDLRMRTQVTGLIEEQGRVVGLRADGPRGPLEVRARLTVGADGRSSTVRQAAALTVDNLGAPIDVLWMRVSRRPDDPDVPMGRFDRGRILIMLLRGDYWQCGFVIPKGGYETIRSRGLEAFRAQLAEIAPFLGDRLQELCEWDHIKLLTVAVDRLRTWHRPGLLCIGDAAHAMSPVGGVGINLAIQDAVASANILAEPLAHGTPTEAELARVQRRRSLPTRVTQALQVFVQNRVISSVLGTEQQLTAPWPVRLVKRWPVLARIPARLIGIGVRPEHVRTPDVWQDGPCPLPDAGSAKAD
jgi:2-polyprenyl-6-methoxyphenol hydroxylase-like FAD-dependent oxidoreductase